MSTLDNDMIFTEILPRLPAKSLMRFKCVSKSFKILISSPHFVQLYLRLSNSSDLLILPDDNRIICYDIKSSPATATATFNRYDSNRITVVGSACGLLCTTASTTGHYFFILNPVTRIRLSIYFPFCNEGLGRILGFAFDHQNLDFKVVGVSDQHTPFRTPTTKVYSLNTRSMMTLDVSFPEDKIKDKYLGGILINKHLLHWMFWKASLRKWRIGCFDVCLNNWVHDVLLPRYYYDPTLKNFLLDFGVLDECLFSTFENRVESCYDVWIMEEYGVQDSWVKLLSIPVSDDLRPGLVPIAYREGSSEILIRQRHSSRLFWYNRMDGRMTEAKFDGALNFPELKVVRMCSKSQVDMPGGKIFPN